MEEGGGCGWIDAHKKTYVQFFKSVLALAVGPIVATEEAPCYKIASPDNRANGRIAFKVLSLETP